MTAEMAGGKMVDYPVGEKPMGPVKGATNDATRESAVGIAASAGVWWLSERDVCSLCGVSGRTVRNWARAMEGRPGAVRTVVARGRRRRLVSASGLVDLLPSLHVPREIPPALAELAEKQRAAEIEAAPVADADNKPAESAGSVGDISGEASPKKISEDDLSAALAAPDTHDLDQMVVIARGMVDDARAAARFREANSLLGTHAALVKAAAEQRIRRREWLPADQVREWTEALVSAAVESLLRVQVRAVQSLALSAEHGRIIEEIVARESRGLREELLRVAEKIQGEKNE